MAITVGGSNITMSDSTVQATAFLGGRATAFTANGTFTIPAGITAVKVTVVGGGAGGSQLNGGASAGTAFKWLTGLTPGNTLAVTIGSAGSGISTSGTSTGGNSSVASGTQSITSIVGNGGSTTNTAGAGSGGTTSGADIGITGQRPTRPGAAAGMIGAPSLFGIPGLSGFNAACCTPIAPTAATGYGAGGGAGPNGSGASGSPGLVIFEY